MCGRYYMGDEPELGPIIEEANRSPLANQWQGTPVRTAGEVRPTDVVPVIASSRSGKRTVYPMKWGFEQPYGGHSLLINARTETAAVKPAFREAWVSHRCIVPASFYFEWEHRTGEDGRKHIADKYGIHPKGEPLTWLCGLYRMEKGLPVFVILTKPPCPRISFIHDRMPLMLPERLVGEWIRPDRKPEAFLSEAQNDMVFAKQPGRDARAGVSLPG